jgi:creatinine amidohydrolase
MPTDLAFRLAARRMIFEYLEKQNGEGWWGEEKFSSYYSENNNPFNYIRIHPCLPAAERYHEFPVDHAGKNETSITMAAHPDTVHMDKLDESIWYSRAGKNGSPEYGNASLDAIVAEMERVLNLN